jgi:large subunit ribosomal protein L20
MARVKRGVTSHARHKKVLKLAEGYRDRNSSNYRIALEKVEKGLRYAYRDRRNKKRSFRALWIQRINAGVRELGLDLTYSQFINGIKRAGIEIDRKVLSDLATREPESFRALVARAQEALAQAAPASASASA